MLRCPHSSSVAGWPVSTSGCAAIGAASFAAGAGGATGAAALGRAGAELARFCASAYFASRMARRLSILLIVHSRDEPTRWHRQSRSPAPVDRVVDGLQPGSTHRVVLRDPGDPAAQVVLEGGYVVAVLRARTVPVAVVQDRPEQVDLVAGHLGAVVDHQPAQGLPIGA